MTRVKALDPSGARWHAKASAESHRGLIVRVAGCSDYFCDFGEALQDEIIARTEHGEI